MSAGKLIVNTFGVMLIGMSVGAVLHGLITMQCIYYFMNFPEDTLAMKSLVALVFVLDNLQLGFMIRTVYEYLVLDFGDLIALLSSVWTLNLEVLLTCLITFIIRLFFTHRIWVVSRHNRPLTLLILIIGLMQLGLGGWLTALMFIEKTFTKLPKFKPSLTLQVSSGIAGDLVIAATLCYYLYKSRTGMGRTKQLLDNLIVFTVNTGLTMAITESAVLITYLTSPTTFVFIAIHFLVSKVYSNSLLASLNNRRRIRTRFGTGYLSEFDAAEGQPPSSDLESSGAPQFSSAIVFGTSGQSIEYELPETRQDQDRKRRVDDLAGRSQSSQKGVACGCGTIRTRFANGDERNERLSPR